MRLTPLNLAIGLALAIALIGWWPLPALVLLVGLALLYAAKEARHA